MFCRNIGSFSLSHPPFPCHINFILFVLLPPWEALLYHFLFKQSNHCQLVDVTFGEN